MQYSIWVRFGLPSDYLYTPDIDVSQWGPAWIIPLYSTSLKVLYSALKWLHAQVRHLRTHQIRPCHYFM